MATDFVEVPALGEVSRKMVSAASNLEAELEERIEDGLLMGVADRMERGAARGTPCRHEC